MLCAFLDQADPEPVQPSARDGAVGAALQGGEMFLRSDANCVLEAERNFRKVVGFRFLAKLDAAPRA